MIASRPVLFPGVRILVSAALVLSAVLRPAAALAQDGAEGAAAPAPAAPGFDRSVAGVSRGNALFEAVIDTYRKAPAIRDKAAVTIRAVAEEPGPEQHAEVPLIISTEGARLVLQDLTFTAIDGTLYGEYAPKPDRLYTEDYDGPLSAGLFTTQLSIYALPHFGLCLSPHPIDELFFFCFDARIVGHRALTDPDLGAVEQIRVESTTDGAPCTLTIDPATRLVRRFESEVRDLLDPTRGWDVITEMNPQVLDEFPHTEFVVRTEDRKEVPSIGFLTAESVTSDLIGAPAPDFSFSDPQGKSITLEDCFGKAVVLVFWWIPSEAQFPILDMLREIESWVSEEKVNALVVPVNCGDRPEDLDLYLQGREIVMPLWRDEGGRASIEDFHTPIWPTTVVISPTGKVTHAFITTDPGATFVERVRHAVKKALEEDL